MFLTPGTLENVAEILATGILTAACILAGGIILAKVFECLAVRRVFRRRRDTKDQPDCRDKDRPGGRRT